MKRKMGFAAAAAYLLLLILLVRAESAYAHSGIRSLWDALWYSLVTITTVGYGDLYPVSPAGKVIGVFFLLLSVGFLAMVIGAAYQLLSGRLFPMLFLYANRRKACFVFSHVSPASIALAENLAEEQPDALQIFCNASADTPGAVRRRGRAFVRGGISEVLAYAGKLNIRCKAFLMSESELINSDNAHALRDCGAELYCCAEEGGTLGGVTYFQPAACCARQYWQEHPIDEAERCVLLVGDGRHAQAMLSCAIVTNCRAPMQSAAYHLFGDWDEYRRVHHGLHQALAMDRHEDGKDALFFHARAWNDDPALIERADRIIFCGEDGDENARLAQVLARSYACSAAVYVRTEHVSAPGMRFGGAKALYTVEMVMKTQLDRRARQMHEQYRRGAQKPTPAWEELDAFLRESNRAAADHMQTKIRMLLGEDAQLGGETCWRAVEKYREADAQTREIYRRNEHERWLRFYSLHNWRYGERKDAKKRCHPCMVSYDELSVQEQAKDDYAWTQLELLAMDAKTQEQI